MEELIVEPPQQYTSLVLFVETTSQDTESYYTGFRYDPEANSFEIPDSSGISETITQQLNTLSNSIGRLFLTTSHQTIISTSGSFFVDNQHFITSSNCLFPSHVAVPPIDKITFKNAALSRRAAHDTEWRRANDATLINGLELVYVSRNLAVFKLPHPVSCVVPLIPVSKAFTGLAEAYVIGYSGNVTLDQARYHYEKLPATEKATIPPPKQADIDVFPAEKKAVFLGKLGPSDTQGMLQLYTSIHGTSGAPIFTNEDGKLKFTAVSIVFGGSDEHNYNCAISCESSEFLRAVIQISK